MIFGRKHFLLNDDVDNSLLGGEPEVPTEEPVVEEPALPENAPEWLKGIDKEYYKEQSLMHVPDVNTLVKNYINQSRLIGRNKIVVPDDNATDDDWKEVFTKLGLPDKEKYNVNFGESKYDDDFKAGFIERAHAAGILPKQAEQMFNFWNEKVTEASTSYSEQMTAQKQEQITALRKEWGAGFDKELATAKQALKQFGDEDLTNFLRETGLGDNPTMIRLFNKIGKNLNEDTFNRDTVSHLGITKDEAQKRIDEIMGNMDHPYWKSEHPNHGKAQEEIQRYWEVLG